MRSAGTITNPSSIRHRSLADIHETRAAPKGFSHEAVYSIRLYILYCLSGGVLKELWRISCGSHTHPYPNNLIVHSERYSDNYYSVRLLLRAITGFFTKIPESPPNSKMILIYDSDQQLTDKAPSSPFNFWNIRLNDSKIKKQFLSLYWRIPLFIWILENLCIMELKRLLQILLKYLNLFWLGGFCHEAQFTLL